MVDTPESTENKRNQPRIQASGVEIQRAQGGQRRSKEDDGAPEFSGPFGEANGRAERSR